MMIKRKNILTDDKLIETIKNYVNEDVYDYAILIDGEWGSGKTYFVREKLKLALEKCESKKAKKDTEYEKRKVIYVSLYGTTSTEDIAKRIYVEVYMEKNEKAKKGVRITGAMLSILFDASKTKEIENGIIENLLSLKNSILIFDDLERCDCPINEILGYINTFVEHNHLKVILVANQREIGKNASTHNQELKYLIAANTKLNFNEPKKDALGIMEISSEEVDMVHINELDTRVSKLFGQNLTYEKIKEKLIGITLYYYPNLSEVMENLILKGGFPEELEDILMKKGKFFKNYMEIENHPNLRTFQFYLSKISEIYSYVSRLENRAKEAFLNYAIEYAYKVAVTFKKGEYKSPWEGTKQIKRVNISLTKSYNSSLGLYFVDDYIINSVLDIETIGETMNIYEDEFFEDRDGSASGLRKLELGWFQAEDKDIEDTIEKMLKEIEGEKYSFREYSRIVAMLVKLEGVGFEKMYLEKAKSFMGNNLSKATDFQHINASFGMICEDREENERCQEVMKGLQSILDKVHEKKSRDSLQEYLELTEDWAEELNRYVEENIRDIREYVGFLSHFDIAELANKIEASLTCDLQLFRRCFNTVYNKGYKGKVLEEEAENIKDLLSALENIDKNEFGKIKSLHFNALIGEVRTQAEVYGKKAQEMKVCKEWFEANGKDNT